MAFPRLPRGLLRLIAPGILILIFWRIYIARQADDGPSPPLVDVRDPGSPRGRDASLPPAAGGPDRTFGCQLHLLQQPLRAVRVSGGINGRTPYNIFLHAPLRDKHISEQLWLSKGTQFFEDGYQEDFANAVEVVQRVTGKEKLVVLDLGANIGLHALFFGKLGHTVHAFEPHPPNFRLLQCSAFLNGFDPALFHPHNLGIASNPSRKRACIQIPEADNQGNAVISSSLEPSRSGCPVGSTAVNLTTLDSFFLSATALASRPVDIMKMDVQGMEHAVLLGASTLMTMSPPLFLFFEFEPLSIRKQGGDPLELLRRLRSYGYSQGYIMPGSGVEAKYKTKSFIGLEEDLAAGKLGGMVDLVAVHGKVGKELGDLWGNARKPNGELKDDA